MSEESAAWRRHRERQDESFQNVQLRFHLAHKLHAMRYGESLKIAGDMVRRAWPPTGEHDTSFEATFRALALHQGGHRPETSYTTEERITNDLDGSFRFWPGVEYDEWTFVRDPRACPKCHGSKVFRMQEPLSLATLSMDVDAMEETVAAIRTVPCECPPPSTEAKGGENG